MTKEDLEELNSWFDRYTKSFRSADVQDQKHIMLKIGHSRNVHENIVRIGEGASLGQDQLLTAQAVALFHDIGRFPQYAKYKTFRDADSVNHGLLGSSTLQEENVLKRLSVHEQKIITESVRFHSAFVIPSGLDKETLMYLKLVRDADKVDIFRVFIEYYESPEDQRASMIAFGVPDIPEYSKDMLACLAHRKIASYSLIKSENDFRLMKLSWVYDLHYSESLRILHERNYIEQIIDLLPRTEEVLSAVTTLRNHVSERLGNG